MRKPRRADSTPREREDLSCLPCEMQVPSLRWDREGVWCPWHGRWPQDTNQKSISKGMGLWLSPLKAEDPRGTLIWENGLYGQRRWRCGQNSTETHFDQHSSPCRPSQESLVSNGKHNLRRRRRRTQSLGTLSNNLPQTRFVATGWLSCCTSPSLQAHRETAQQGIARHSEKVENKTIEAHTRILSSFKQCCTKNIVYAKPAFEMGLLCSPAGAQRTEFYTTWKMPFAVPGLCTGTTLGFKKESDLTVADSPKWKRPVCQGLFSIAVVPTVYSDITGMDTVWGRPWTFQLLFNPLLHATHSSEKNCTLCSSWPHCFELKLCQP